MAFTSGGVARDVYGNGITGKNLIATENGNKQSWLFLPETWGKICKIEGFCKTQNMYLVV